MPKIIENIRERIIEVAYNLFIQEGYEQVKTGRIARDCEIAAGTLFNYFPTKWDLLREILDKVKEYGLKEFLQAMQENPDGYKRLQFAVSGMFYIIDRIGKLGKDFFIYILSLDEAGINRWKHEDPISEQLMLKSLRESFPQMNEFSEDELHLLLHSFQALVIAAYTPDEKEQEARKRFVCRSFIAMLNSKKYDKEC
ncbi:MAG: TetR/AcrR family transcriptional regulator; helix-turn-helix transcriptional regulator [Candidatus Cloacimonetes bacterium]|nr:TetR/AcrR family transcriptional regulator; helix-turn-helix transcriptional regulator [Candidatus Cloacimonadota bacterium]